MVYGMNKKLMTMEEAREIRVRIQDLRLRQPLKILEESHIIRDRLISAISSVRTDENLLPKLALAWAAVIEVECRILGVPKVSSAPAQQTLSVDSSSIVVRPIEANVETSVPRGTSEGT